jgi:hypothetical protein
MMALYLFALKTENGRVQAGVQVTFPKTSEGAASVFHLRLEGT